MTLELETRIRALAHQFWEQEGRPKGMEMEHWRRAQQQLQSEQADGLSGSGPAGEQLGNRDPRAWDGMGGDPDGAQSGQTKEQVFLQAATRLAPD